MDVDLSSITAIFASIFNQDNRLFSLRFTESWLDAKLLPHTLSGEEHISKPFKFNVECLSSEVDLELKSLIGQGADIVVHRDEGDRILSGIVTRAQQLGSDGGFARYGLIVEPAFAVLKLRRNSRVFQDKSVVDIVGLILDEHIQSNPAFAQYFRHRELLTQKLSPRSYCQQYRESDFDFISRLLSEEGISYYFDFEHGAEEIGLHTLVLFDAGSKLKAAQHDTVRFHRADATENEDAITQWHAQRQIQSGKLQLASFDYKGVYSQRGSDTSVIDHGQSGEGLTASLEDYDPQSLYYGSDNSELNRYAQLRQQANDLRTKSFFGEGAVRGLGAGQTFALTQHPNHESDNEFAVLSQTFEARNNLPGEFESHPIAATGKKFALTEAGYQNKFQAVRKGIAVVPNYAHSDHAKPTARGVQTATVVGPAGEEIFTDELGRIKVQFHWARSQDHDTGIHGAGANKDDHSSCWVRVQMPSAGAQWGHQFIPRVGQEVLVDFVEGDIDRPVVTHVIHNGQQTPPTFQQAGSLPANKTLSGIKTHEYKGGRHNEIVFDDTTNEIRTTLSTEHGKTQLNQGYLIHPRSEGKGSPRGEGFELRTDNAGAIRAAQGLLVTTEAQASARGKQLDRSPALAQLEAAQNLSKQIGDTAQQQRANKPNIEPALNVDQLKDKKPHVLMHGHGGVGLTTPQSLTFTTGKDFNQVSLRDTNQTSGKRWIHNVGESTSLFVANAQSKIKTAIKLLAAKGDVLVQAQSNDVEITADKNVKITACKNTLTASAGKEFLLQSGGGYIKISGGNVDIHCPGKLSMKAASFVHTGGSGGSVAVPVMPVAAFMAPGAFAVSEAAAATETAAAATATTTGLSILAPVTAFIGGMLYSSSTGGKQQKISSADGTVYTKYQDEVLYTATAQNGKQWTTASPQDDIGYRTWLANGGNGSMQNWVSDGRPSGLESKNPNASSIKFNPEIKKHLSEIDGFSQKKGVIGAHNLSSFNKAAKEYDLKIVSVTKHPTIKGISEIEYQVPALDREGNTVGYKNKIFTKTVYDPQFLSDDKVFNLGTEAAKNGYPDAVSKGLSQYSSEAGGVQFHTYVRDGIVSNFHPEF